MVPRLDCTSSLLDVSDGGPAGHHWAVSSICLSTQQGSATSSCWSALCQEDGSLAVFSPQDESWHPCPAGQYVALNQGGLQVRGSLDPDVKPGLNSCHMSYSYQNHESYRVLVYAGIVIAAILMLMGDTTAEL